MHRTCSHSSKFPVVIPILLLCSERVLAASLPQGKNIFCISFPQDCHSTSSKMNCTPFVVDTGRMDWTLNYSTHKSRWKEMCGEKFYSITPLRACSALFIAFWTLLFYPFPGNKSQVWLDKHYKTVYSENSYNSTYLQLPWKTTLLYAILCHLKSGLGLMGWTTKIITFKIHLAGVKQLFFPRLQSYKKDEMQHWW